MKSYFKDDSNIQQDFIKQLHCYLDSLNVRYNIENIPSPLLKYDAYIVDGDKKIGIDIHDISGGRPEIYQRGPIKDKLRLSFKFDIKSIQILSDEWINKNDICKSVIANALGKSGTKLNARDCSIELSTQDITKDFLNEAHMQGSTRSGKHFILRHKIHGIVATATFRKPIQQKKYGNVIELARMAIKPGFSVRGGASKLISHAKQYFIDEGYTGILSYADLRFGLGNVYLQCGFSLINESNVNYFYTDGQVRYDRFKFRAFMGRSEKEVVADAGVRPIWCTGHRVFLLNLEK